MSLAFEAGRAVGRLGRRVDIGWRRAREAFREGLRDGLRDDPAGGLSRRRLEELYGLLELSPGAGLEEVERSWRRLVREYHPDRFAGDAERQRHATELVAALNDARGELKRYLAGR